jgi:hypothetical protein
MLHSTQKPPPPVTSALLGLLGVTILANLLVVWTVSALPMSELGLHVQLLDIAARYYDVQAGYRGWYIAPHVLDPGTLALWFARALPFLRAWTVAKCLVSLYVIALPISLLALARSMGRSPWLALFAAPLTWNALVNAGYLNVLLALPLLFAALALARVVATQGGLSRSIRLALTLVLLYFAHFFVFLLAAVSVTFLFFWYRQDAWSLTRLWVLLPSVPLLIQLGWRQLVAAQTTAILNLHRHTQPLTTYRLPTRQLLARLYDWTLAFFTDHTDQMMGVAVAFLVVLLWGIGRWDAAHANHGLLDSKSFERRMFGRRKWTWERVVRTVRDGSLWSGTFDRRRPRWVNISAWLNDHGLEALTLTWVLLYFILPTQFRGVPVVAELMPVPTILLLSIWPRMQFVEWRVWLAVPLVVVALGYSWQVRDEFATFAQNEVAGLPEQLADLPAGARFAAVLWQRESSVTFKAPVVHLPTGLFAAQHGGLTSDTPAAEPQPILRFRKGMFAPQLQPDFWRDPALADLDFVLVRTATEPQEAQESPLLEHVWHGGSWWLFRVVPGDRARIKVATAGGTGGQAAYADCPRGQLLQGLSVQPGVGAIQSVVPLCQDPRSTQPRIPAPIPLTRLGVAPEGAAESQLTCPHGQYVVSLSGHTSDFVTAVQVQCATAPWPAAQLGLTPTRLVGTDGRKDFDLRCPEAMVAVGVQGRFGDLTDEIGLACAELATW